MATLEKKLEKAYKNGNRQNLEIVFKEIYETYYKYLFCIGRQYLKSKEDIEDVCNDVFINFFNQLGNFDYEKSIKYYLATACKNASINKAKLYAYQSDYVEIENCGVEDESPQGVMEILEKILEKEELEIVELHVIYGYTFQEIGEEKNKPLNTVKSLYRRALEKVKEEIGDE